ncbi:MAG: peptide chain release factor 3, partial [Actinomycetota bacterium]
MSKENDVLFQAARRRTFAIISHPDAGKTTLTEKFLLYAGAVQEAGAVKARAGARSSTSDWMALERERGISISSTVLQFPYRDHVFNLLDTPGHKDFSEDTYRVLAAVDAVVMVLDIAKGIESQTLKLFQVCRSRNLPVLTFFNKYDRPGRDPLELLDEVEQQIGLRPTPATWPVGIPGDFRGVIDRRTNEFIRFTRTARGGSAAPEEIVPKDRAAAEEGPAWQTALEGCALLDGIGANVDLESFLAGETTPVFVGSALTNFGVRMLLDAVIDLAPSAAARQNLAGETQALDNEFSAFVFKIQANMNPRHRDLLAFARVCTGRFERGMDVTCARTKKVLSTKYATSAFGADRTIIQDAYPGDVIGLINAAGLKIGDTLYVSKPVEYPAVPRFAPEVY